LPGLPTQALKGKPGRKGKHETNGAKTAACRARAKEELIGQLAQINEGSFSELSYPSLDENETNSCNENTYREGHFVTPISHGDVFGSIYDATACMSVGSGDTDEFIALLRGLHDRVLVAKEDSGLVSPSRFDPDASAETKRGLANVKYVSGIWFDNDGGDLGFKDFARLFPYLRMAIWNTYSHTPQKPRWRVFIPTSLAMSLDVHRMIMKKFEMVLNKNGYWTKNQLGKNRRIKNGLRHGFDESKFNAASLFYLPCQAQNPADSFFDEFNDASRGPLNVGLWLDDCIAGLRPEPEPEAVAVAAWKPLNSAGVVSNQLSELRRELQAKKAAKPNHIIENAVQDWRLTPRGDGHAAFFRLARTLHWAGLTDADLTQTLREEAAYAHSPAKRRAEIRELVKRLGRSGQIGGRKAA
jgi:hypothetical protein